MKARDRLGMGIVFLFGLLKGYSSHPAELLGGADRTWGSLVMQIMQKLSAQALMTCVTWEGCFQGLSGAR